MMSRKRASDPCGQAPLELSYSVSKGEGSGEGVLPARRRRPAAGGGGGGVRPPPVRPLFPEKAKMSPGGRFPQENKLKLTREAIFLEKLS